MAASVLRSRMLRKHPKRTLRFSEARRNILDSLHDAAKNGNLGPQAQSAVNTLDDLSDHSLNVLSGDSSRRFGSGGNDDQGDDQGGDGNDDDGGGGSNNGEGRDNNGGGGSNGNNKGGNNGNNGVGNNGGGNNGNNGGGNNGNSNNHSTGGSFGGINGNNPPPGVDGDSSGNSPTISPPSSSENSNSGKNSGGSTSNVSTGSNIDSGPSAASVSINTGSAPSSSPTRQSGSSLPSPTISAILVTTSPSNTVSSSVSSAPSSTSTDFAAPQANLSKHSNRGAIAGGVVGALVFLFLIFAAWMVYKRRYKDRLPPSAEFISNPAPYPFAPGFGNTTSGREKNEISSGNYSGTGTGAVAQAKLKPFSADSAEGILSEKRPQVGQYRDAYFTQPLPAPPQPEVLYTTPARAPTPSNVPAAGSTPGTPTTPNGRRIPFGTGTFQFPPRPPQMQLPRHSSPP